MKKLTVLIALGCMLAGCASRPATSQSSQLEIPKTVQKTVNSQFSVDAAVETSESVKTGTVTCALGTLVDSMSKEAVCRELFFKQGEKPQLTTDDGCLTLETQDICVGYTTEQEFTVNSTAYQYRSNCITLNQSAESYNADLYKKTTDLPFMSQEKALQEVRTTLAKLGLSVGDVIQCYAMDHQTMQQEEDTTDVTGENHPKNGKGTWSAQDDTYYFLMSQEYNGFPVVYNGYTGQGFAPGEDCSVMLTADGIIGCTIEGCYDWKQDKEVSVISPEEALQVMEEHYAYLQDRIVKISGIKFAMDIMKIDESSAKLIPAWVFTAEITDSSLDTSETVLLAVDAETGKEITENTVM